MKVLKTLILVILGIAIGTVGYMIYDEYRTESDSESELTEFVNTCSCGGQECTQAPKLEINQVNDSTYHVCINDTVCVMFEKSSDSLTVYVTPGVPVDYNETGIGVCDIWMGYNEFFDTTGINNYNLIRE